MDGLWFWVIFGAVVVTLMVLDLGVFHRKAHAASTRESAIWTGLWVGLALAFNLVILVWRGPQPALEFFTGYLVEYSLSVDNLFVFVVLFGAFGVNAAQQHRVLFWGILGALLMRGALIAGGAALMEGFSWMVYVFGGFLILTGLKIGFQKESTPNPENNPILRLLCRFLPVSRECADGKFVIRRDGRWLVTPLFLVLVTLETTDLLFALDSIPAIFAITTDPLIVYTSNIFAILGLRSLYFLLAGAVGKFHYLRPALAVILTFVGLKMTLAHFLKIPIAVSLGVIVLVLLAGILASWLRNRRLKAIQDKPAACESPPD
jgi:tellurite resistance protein TerC